jgi:hypothetical protein
MKPLCSLLHYNNHTQRDLSNRVDSYLADRHYSKTALPADLCEHALCTALSAVKH